MASHWPDQRRAELVAVAADCDLTSEELVEIVRVRMFHICLRPFRDISTACLYSSGFRFRVISAATIPVAARCVPVAWVTLIAVLTAAWARRRWLSASMLLVVAFEPSGRGSSSVLG